MIKIHNTDKQNQQYGLFIGRFQPFHKKHQEIIDYYCRWIKTLHCYWFHRKKS